MRTLKTMGISGSSWTKVCAIAALFVCVAGFSGCSKDGDKDERPSLEDGKSKVIYDLAGDTEAAMGSTAPGKETRPFNIFLFRLSDQRQIWVKNTSDSEQLLKSKDWDLAFTGPYNSEVFVNNASQKDNPGLGGAATKTAVVLIESAYDKVMTAPTDAQFDESSSAKIGWAASASSDGWFRYSDKDHLMQALPNRTYAIRLPDGKYAKLQLVSAYKGNPPVVTNVNWPAPYYTFRYFVQQDGSKNLNTQ